MTPLTFGYIDLTSMKQLSSVTYISQALTTADAVKDLVALQHAAGRILCSRLINDKCGIYQWNGTTLTYVEGAEANRFISYNGLHYFSFATTVPSTVAGKVFWTSYTDGGACQLISYQDSVEFAYPALSAAFVASDVYRDKSWWQYGKQKITYTYDPLYGKNQKISCRLTHTYKLLLSTSSYALRFPASIVCSRDLSSRTRAKTGSWSAILKITRLAAACSSVDIYSICNDNVIQYQISLLNVVVGATASIQLTFSTPDNSEWHFTAALI